MTTATRPHRGVSFRQAAAHTAIITRRNVLRVVRLPELILFSTVQPVMFLLLFNYVFGGAINLGGGGPLAISYIDWLIPGVLVQSAVFGATATALGLTEDLAAGVIDRFRSLPMARSAVLTGRTAADLVRNTFVFSLMLVVGYLMGWRFDQGFFKMVVGLGLALMFGYAFSWVMLVIGLATKTPEAAQSAGFLPIFPLVFASSVFVPPATMPDWLRAFAENQPVSIAANAVRALMLPDSMHEPLGFDQGGLVLQSILWIGAIIVVFAPLSVRMYKRTVG